MVQRETKTSQMSGISECWSFSSIKDARMHVRWLPDDYRHMRAYVVLPPHRSTIDRSNDQPESSVRHNAIFMHLSHHAWNVHMHAAIFRHVAYFYLLVGRNLMMRFTCESNRIRSSHSSTTNICLLPTRTCFSFVSSIVIFSSSVSY